MSWRVCCIVYSAGLDDWDAMALIRQRRVLPTALPRNKNLPQTCWMNCLALSPSRGAFDSCIAYCLFGSILNWDARVWCLMAFLGNVLELF